MVLKKNFFLNLNFATMIVFFATISDIEEYILIIETIKEMFLLVVYSKKAEKNK